MTAKTAEKTQRVPSRKSWVYGILVVLVLGVLAYFGLMNRQDRAINLDYYRVLYEASETFNLNLNILDSMHKYDESASSIRSLLPTYRRLSIAGIEKKEQKTRASNDFKYEFKGDKILVHNKELYAQLEYSDILPTPRKGFSRYLFADQAGNVVAFNGGEKTISIVDLSSINQQIRRKNKQFQFNINESTKEDSPAKKEALPSYSNHVDMKISYGEFRVFVFPFSLSIPLQKEKVGDGKPSISDRLYLVGLLPEQKLAARDSGHWNISLLVVTLTSLLFMWSMLRLYLLPKNQSITQTFRVITNVSSYLFYIVIIALTLAYFQKSLLQNIKDDEALNYAYSLKQDIQTDLSYVFNGLNNYRNFYQQLLKILAPLKESETASDSTKSDINALVSDLSRCTNDSCNEINQDSDNGPIGIAATYNRRYHLNDECQETNGGISCELDFEAIDILQRAHQSDQGGVATLNFYSSLQKVNLKQDEGIINSYYHESPTSPLSHKILTVFAVNGNGNSLLPSIYFQESNSPPFSFSLSHRNYYKKVRDQKGWDLTLSDEGGNEKTFQNVYIQRLLNINNGTRGTTISMPLIDPDSDTNTDLIGNDHIIGADVLLPSLSLGRPPPLDFTYMVVERSSGDVLFHNNAERSLVGNLYFSGDTGNKLSRWIKAGIEQNADKSTRLLEGIYHGQKGRFALSSTAVNDWAIVIFYPDSTLQAVMTNQFLFISVSFALTMAVMMLFIYAVRNFIWTSALKEKLMLPAKLNVRFVMLVSSLMLSASYSLYLLGINIDTLFEDTKFSIWLPLTGLIVATLLIYRGSVKLFSFPPDISVKMTQLKSRRGAVLIIFAVLMVTFVHFIYIEKTANAHTKSMDYHYQQIQCNWLNYERVELISTGLSRYANSITIQRIDPLLLLPLEEDWYYTLRNSNSNCDNRFATSNLPEDFPSMGGLTGSIQIWQWINNFLLGQNNHQIVVVTPSEAKVAAAAAKASAVSAAKSALKAKLTADADPDSTAKNNAATTAGDAADAADKAADKAEEIAKAEPESETKANSANAATAASALANEAATQAAIAKASAKNQEFPLATTLLQAILLIAIIILWFKFNTKLLWYKLYCPERFMQHITRMTESVRSLEYEVRNNRLRIECDTIKLDGVGLALLLRTKSYKSQNNTDGSNRVLLEGFTELFEMSPCLQKFSQESSFLPNLKLDLGIDPSSGLLNVQIWDIDTCLEKGTFRELLLDMIMELKSLTLSNQLHSFTIFAGFHSLQRVKMKDPLLLEKSSLLDHAEYLSWAECLMDFVVIVPDNFKKGVDFELLEQEVEAFPELKFLAEPYEKTQQQGTWSHVLKRNEELYQESNWATINYILLNADALYRFKWESCSSAEKLALLNLAKKHRINPANTQMIEHLVLNGLITVRKGHLDIVNRSFAQFVLHAETRATLNQLVSQGEAGVWKNYKLPLGIMILLIIGGIALTSGESLYIIAASMAGVLGTIASVTNSANMLRGGPKE